MHKEQEPHFGEMFKNYILEHNLSRTELAEKVQKTYSAVWKYEKAQSIQSSIIWEISVALKHNFFADLAAKLPTDFTKNAQHATTKNDEVKALKAELHTAKTELNVLKEVMMAN